MELLSVLLFAAVGFAAGGTAMTLLNRGRVRHAAAAARSAAHTELAGLKLTLEEKEAELSAARARLEQQGGDVAGLVAQAQQAADALAASTVEKGQLQQQVAAYEERVRRLQQEVERWERQAEHEISARQAEAARRSAAEQRGDLLESQRAAESCRFADQQAELEGLRGKLAELLAPVVPRQHANGNGHNGHVLLLAAPEPPPSAEAVASGPAEPPPRVCLFCGSSRNLEDTHLDGRSEHVSPENRAAACRACNNRFGTIFRRMGLGRRSRIAGNAQGARSLGQWAAALASVKGDGCSMPLAEAVGLLRATPPDKRARFTEELWGKRSNRR